MFAKNVSILYWIKKMMIIKIPTKIKMYERKNGSAKYWEMNLNEYRNAHYRVLSEAKRNFTESMREFLENRSKADFGVAIQYELFVPNKRRIDANNVLSVVDKFFSDALVKYNIIEDDNYNYIHRTKFLFGGIDKSSKEKYVRITVFAEKEFPEY